MKTDNVLDKNLASLKSLIRNNNVEDLFSCLTKLFRREDFKIKPINNIYQQLMDELLVEATYRNSVEVVELLYYKFPMQPDSNYASCLCLRNTISNNNMNLLNFLFFDSQVKIKPQLHIKDDVIFEMVLNKNDEKLLEFFINKCQVEKTGLIDSLLTYYTLGEKAEQLFFVRDLERNLTNKPISKNFKI